MEVMVGDSGGDVMGKWRWGGWIPGWFLVLWSLGGKGNSGFGWWCLTGLTLVLIPGWDFVCWAKGDWARCVDIWIGFGEIISKGPVWFRIETRTNIVVC